MITAEQAVELYKEAERKKQRKIMEEELPAIEEKIIEAASQICTGIHMSNVSKEACIILRSLGYNVTTNSHKNETTHVIKFIEL